MKNELDVWEGLLVGRLSFGGVGGRTCRSKEKGKQSWNVEFDRKLLKNAGQLGEVKLLPRLVSKGIGRSSCGNEVAVWIPNNDELACPAAVGAGMNDGVADMLSCSWRFSRRSRGAGMGCSLRSNNNADRSLSSGFATWTYSASAPGQQKSSPNSIAHISTVNDCHGRVVRDLLRARVRRCFCVCVPARRLRSFDCAS